MSLNVTKGWGTPPSNQGIASAGSECVSSPMQRQVKRALAGSRRQQETEQKAKQQNEDADGGWELFGSSCRGGLLHQDRGPENKRSRHRETEQRPGDERRRPMTTGDMHEGRPGGDGQRHR
jgi:hypothetical protein